MTDPIGAGRKLADSLGGYLDEHGHIVVSSTSAQLRETQAALAASQADLTAMEQRLLERTTEVVELTRERDEARENAESASHLLERIEKAAGAEDTDPFTDLAEFVGDMRADRDEADRVNVACVAELASARAELEQLRRDRSRSRAEWRALLEALGIDPDTVETPLMQAKRIGQLADEAPVLRADLERRNRYVATLERSLSDADAAIERLRGES